MPRLHPSAGIVLLLQVYHPLQQVVTLSRFASVSGSDQQYEI